MKSNISSFWYNMERMTNSVNQASAMTTNQLTCAVAELKLEGGEHIASLESAVKGEVIHRLQHPFTWWLRRLFKR